MRVFRGQCHQKESTKKNFNVAWNKIAALCNRMKLHCVLVESAIKCYNASPPTPWGHEACRWSLKPKPLPPLVSSHHPKLILRGEVYLSPPPLHWVVAPAFNICSDYSRSRNLMLSPRLPLKKMTFSVFGKCHFWASIFVPRRFSLEVSSSLKCSFFKKLKI